MEAAACLKSVVVAANQYLNSTSETHLAHLQRQLDVLVSGTNNESLLTYFAACDLLSTQCLTCLIELLSEQQVKPVLAQKIMLLLSTLANDEDIRELLQQTFHITTCLTNYLRCTIATPSDPTVLQCVTLLRQVTYNCRISLQEPYLDELIKFVVKNIQGKENELTQPCLGILANISKHNFSVQNHVRNMENVKSFYKALITYPTHKNKKTVIFALAILTNICMYEELGAFLFKAQNIYQTFQLIFNILLHADSSTTRTYAVDLLQEILHEPVIQDQLLRYNHLEQCISEILQLIGKENRQSVRKVFNLLLSFCSLTGFRSIVSRSVLMSDALQNAEHYKVLLAAPNKHRTQPFFAIVHLAGQSVDTHHNIPHLALELLKEIYQEVIDLGLVGQMTLHIEQVLPVVTEAIIEPLDTTRPSAAKHCMRTVRALQFLIALASDDKLQAEAASTVNIDYCLKLIEQQLSHNKIAISQTHNSLNSDNWSEVGVEVVLYSLELMSRFRRHVVQMDEALKKVLQDSRLVPFLAYAMSSANRSHVQMALSLVSRCTLLPEFPTIVLGESIAANNSAKSAKLAHNKIGDSVTNSPKSLSWIERNGSTNKKTKPKASGDNVDLDNTVDLLIEKMQMGEVKNVKMSEIINVYEHKLQSLQTKENHLEDLLEAKALALSQADRLISQYRCRRAQSDAEAQNLRSMLCESEQGAEQQDEKLNELETERSRLLVQVEQAVAEITRLEAVAEEHHIITQSYREQTQKLENTTRNLATLKQEHKTLTEMHDTLRRHDETLKQQHETVLEQLSQLEMERETLSRNLQEKEAHEMELSKSLAEVEECLEKTTKERNDLEKALDRQRQDLTKAEKNKRQLQHQVSTLEVVCQKHQDAIIEKDITLNAQKTELEKHAQIAALIHNLSSGAQPQ